VLIRYADVDVFPLTINGIIDASATIKFSTPYTLSKQSAPPLQLRGAIGSELC
jgi:hypothetical protein